jgi:hypothetical protein
METNHWTELAEQASNKTKILDFEEEGKKSSKMKLRNVNFTKFIVMMWIVDRFRLLSFSQFIVE